jgi:hypothetical protein
MVPLKMLLLDAENPRLPASMQGADQETLAVNLEMGFEAFTVAESIALNGYFNSEPLIVIRAPDRDEYWVVVEGNRRLAALFGLAHAEFRREFPDPDKWETLAQRADITGDTLVPVVVVKSRAVVVPIIGFRHISGILQWTPYAQARYVAKLVDQDHMSLPDVAKMIGIDRTRAGNLYRDQAIARQAQSLGIETGPLESSFSLLTVAMGNVQLREHIQAPLGSRLEPGHDPVPEERISELRELVTWVFGDGDTQPLVSDSREISLLARVVGSPVGLKAIRGTETLQAAAQRIEDAGADPRTRLMKRLHTARKSLVAAADDMPAFVKDNEVRGAVEDARNAIDALQELIDGS